MSFSGRKKLIEFIIKMQEVKSSCRKAQTSGLGELPKPQIMDYGVYEKGKEKKPQLSSKKRVYA